MNFDKRINQKLRDINVTPQEVFTSGPFNHYLRSLLSYPCRSIHRKLPPIQVGWEALKATMWRLLMISESTSMQPVTLSNGLAAS